MHYSGEKMVYVYQREAEKNKDKNLKKRRITDGTEYQERTVSKLLGVLRPVNQYGYIRAIWLRSK